MKYVKCIVSGKVQGVGFRWSVKHEADTLKIKGYAENLSDGSVEILACGDNGNIEKIMEWLNKGGPMFAKIGNVRLHEVSLDQMPDTFETR